MCFLFAGISTYLFQFLYGGVFRLTENVFFFYIDQMTELFQRNKSTISRHIRNVFEEESQTHLTCTPKVLCLTFVVQFITGDFFL